jgi:hypothetical protein
MGGQQSKTEVLKEVLNKVAIDVINKKAIATNAYINQKNQIRIVGTSGNISGIKQVNSAVLNVSVMSESITNAELQSDLSAAITEAISQEAPAIGYSANQTKVKSIVENEINSSIRTETLQEIHLSIDQENLLEVVQGTNLELIDLVQNNEATLIMELIDATNSNIISRLTNEAVLEGDLDQTTQSLFSFGSIIGIILVGIAFLLYTGGERVTALATNPVVMGSIVGLIILYFAYSQFT